MKYIIIISFICICSFGFGQLTGGGTFFNVGETTIDLEHDTSKVLMLVCDTTKFSNSSFTINAQGCINLSSFYGDVYWQYGYEVATPNGWIDSDILILDVNGHSIDHKRPAFFSKTYLDADKQPLKKSIIVWQTIPINK